MNRLARIILPLVLSLALHDPAHAKDSPLCQKWLAMIVKSPTDVEEKGPAAEAGPTEPTIFDLSGDPWHVALLTESESLEVIQCLLGAENDTRPSAINGAIRLNVSQLFAPTTANLAALYFISYIYTGRFDHGAAVALRGEDAASDSKGRYAGYVTKPSAVHRAYRASRAWFAKARRMGLANARRAGLQPLDGTGLFWY
jgi:hypothetical protein